MTVQSTNKGNVLTTDSSVGVLIIGVLVVGDKESKKKQKSPASSGPAAQVVVMRELKWDHQVCMLQ